MTSDQIILHHYPQSPVTEKVRVVLGIKRLDWQSVLIPRLPPKPNLTALTGGYRLTPVMQIGADIYCDTSCIIREIEQRVPAPTLFPGGTEGLTWGNSQWTDGPLFKDVVTVALVEMSPNMPPEFLADRGPIYFGDDFSLDALKANYTNCLANIRTQFGWIDNDLESKDFLAGDTPSLNDVLAYYLVWFLQDRLPKGSTFFQQFSNLIPWKTRMRDIGHGNPQEMDDLQALKIATTSEPQIKTNIDPNDPLGLKAGDKITVQPAAGGPKVAGTLHILSRNNVSLLRQDEIAGKVCVHFPRIGYKIALASD